MTSTPQTTTMPFAGSRLKTCCGRLGVCACRRPDSGITSIPNSFGSNSLSQNGVLSFFSFNKCKRDSCKLKCKDNGLVLPLNNFRSSVNGRHSVIETDCNLDCSSSNVVYLVTCTVCSLQYVGETKR